MCSVPLPASALLTAQFLFRCQHPLSSRCNYSTMPFHSAPQEYFTSCSLAKSFSSSALFSLQLPLYLSFVVKLILISRLQLINLHCLALEFSLRPSICLIECICEKQDGNLNGTLSIEQTRRTHHVSVMVTISHLMAKL